MATTVAVAVALVTPYVNAALQQGQKRAAALKLATLAAEAIGENPNITPFDDRRETMEAHRVWRHSLLSLIRRMDAMPSENIDDAAALAAFIWVADLAREALSLDPSQVISSPADLAELSMRQSELYTTADNQAQLMKVRFRHRRLWPWPGR